MEMTQFMARVYFTDYSVSTVGSLCSMFPFGHIWQMSVLLVQSHLKLVILFLLAMLYPYVRRIFAGVSYLECIVAEPSSFHCHDIRYWKNLLSERLPSLLKSFRLKSWVIFFMCLVRFIIVCALVKSGSCERHIRTESSTYAPPILCISAPVRVVSLKQVYLLAMDHKIGPRTATHMDGEAQVPCPFPRICLSTFDM